MESIKFQGDTKRIEWIDVFKGILIILVVIGHSTGIFNQYIYQFHMAAFFFISGYTTNQNKDGVIKTIYKKICTMKLPLTTVFFLFLFVMVLLNKFGLYNVFFSEELPYLGVSHILKQYFFKGSIFVWWLGAAWFIVELFKIVVLQKVIFTVLGKKIDLLYFLVSLFLFAVGYYVIKNNINAKWIDLTLIGQFYYVIGLFFKDKRIFEFIGKNKWIRLIYFLVSLFILFYFVKKGLTVDYPSRRFNNMVLDCIAGVNGIVLIYLISSVLKMVGRLKKALIYIGENTLAIVLLHFMFFNVTFYILYVCGVVPFEYIHNFVFTKEIGAKFWLLNTVITIGLSLVVWKLVVFIKPMSFLLGNERERYNAFYNRFEKCNAFRRFEEAVEKVNLTEFIYLSISKFKKVIYENKLYTGLIIALSSLCLAPFVNQGIVLNDEVLGRMVRFSGFINVLKYNIHNEIRMGRPLRIGAAFNTSLGFIFQNTTYNRIFQMVVIFISLIAFGWFIYKIFKSKGLCILVPLIAIIYMPGVFEHSAPNAFNCLVAIPMIELLVSLGLFCDYIERKNVHTLIGSIILLCISILGYEFILTYLPLYILIYILHRGNRNKKLCEVLKVSSLFVGIGILYLFLMFLFKKAMPGEYQGVEMTFISFKSSFDILWTLFKSALPGYFAFSRKYIYLSNLYKGNLGHVIDIRIILLFFITVATLGKCLVNMKYREKEEGNRYIDGTIGFYIGKLNIKVLTVVIILVYMMIPSLPNSISSLYQGNVNGNNFTALPVTYFLNFTAALLIGYIVYSIVLDSKKSVKTKYIPFLVVLMISGYAVPIQIMNNIVTNRQMENYKSMEFTEKVVLSNTFKSFNNYEFYAPDIHEQRDLLVIQDGYFSEIAKSRGLNIVFNNEYKKDSAKIYKQADHLVTVSINNHILVFSSCVLGKELPIKVDEERYLAYDFNGKTPMMDSGLYVYSMSMKGEGNPSSSLEESSINVEGLKMEAGTTLETINKVSGFYPDGWVTDECEFRIKSGEMGVITINGYYPKEITGNEKIGIYLNDECVKEYTIEEQNFVFEFSAPANSVSTITLKNNFSFKAEAPDIRNLSFILADMEGK